MVGISSWFRAAIGKAARPETAAADVLPGNLASPEPPDLVTQRDQLSGDGRAFVVGCATDMGRVRDHNEDAFLVLAGQQESSESIPSFGLFMVADGMGGHENGEAASALALRTSASWLVSHVYIPLLSGVDRGASQPALADVVRDAIQAANHAVSQVFPGSGSTLTCCMVLGNRLTIGHVGDSRAYLIRPGTDPRILTRDHSYVGRLIEEGQMTADEALVHPRRNILYRALGQTDGFEVDVHTCSLEPADRLLLCSDGLWNLVEEPEICRLAGERVAPQIICERLVNAANEAGGADNITVVLAQVPSS